MINMISFLLQLRANESDGARAARLAQMRDHNAEVREMLMFLVMKHIMMLIQVRGDESDEATAARRAQDRDHHAEVLHKSNHDD